MRKLLLALSLLLLLPSLYGQVRRDSASRIRFGSSLPATCNADIGQVFFIVDPGSPVGMHQCLSTDTWTQIGSGTITGSGAANQVALFDGASSITSGTDLTFASDILTVGDGSTANTEIQVKSTSDGTAGIDFLSTSQVNVGTASGTAVDVSFIRGGTIIFEINNDSIGMGQPAASKDLRWIHETAPIDAIFLDGADRTTNGTTDSHSILWTGRTFDGSAHDSDWIAFVDSVNNDGTASRFTFQTRVDAAAYADSFVLTPTAADFLLGSAALPSIIFGGEVDTGIYKQSTSVLFSADANAVAGYSRDGLGNERFLMSNDTFLVWCSGSAQGCGPQFGLSREAADAGGNPSGDLFLSNSHWSVYNVRTSTNSYSRSSTRFATDTISGITGASDTTIATLIPNGAIVLGVTTEIDVALGTTNGTTGYQVGDGVDPDRWGDITGTTLNTFSDNADFTGTGVDIFTAAQAVTITAVGGDFDGTGDIEVRVHWMEVGNRR